MGNSIDLAGFIKRCIQSAHQYCEELAQSSGNHGVYASNIEPAINYIDEACRDTFSWHERQVEGYQATLDRRIKENSEDIRLLSKPG